MRRFLFPLLFVVSWSIGCPSPSLRTGETLESGQFGMSAGINFAIPELGPDAPEPAPIDVFNGFGFVVDFTLGLPAGCEATAGFRTMTTPLFAEARCGLFQERRGDGLSLAPGAGIGWSVIAPEGELPIELRGWVDVSKKLGGAISPLMRVEYARGPMLRHKYRGTRGLHSEQGPYVLVPSSAGRLNVTLGAAVHIPNGDDLFDAVLVGVTPYWVLHTEDEELPTEGWGGSLGFRFQ